MDQKVQRPGWSLRYELSDLLLQHSTFLDEIKGQVPLSAEAVQVHRTAVLVHACIQLSLCSAMFL